MTGIILAAGIGLRLRPLTEALPKALLPVGGKPLLQRSLEALTSAGLGRCVIVTGYLQEKIEEFVRRLHPPLAVEFIHNPAFAETNNNYSLWLARPAVSGEEIVLLDADILFHPHILTRLLASQHSDALILRTTNTLGHEEIKCELDGSGAVTRIGKQLDPAKAAGESLGIERFSAPVAARLFDVLARRHVYDEFYEASFQELIDGGVRIHAVDSGGLPCVEIDTPEDLAAAEHLVRQLP